MLEFPAGLCVDCGMSVPDGDIICDQCKAAWQLYSVSGNVGPAWHSTIQSWQQELQDQDGVRLVPPTSATDAPICDGQEKRGC